MIHFTNFLSIYLESYAPLPATTFRNQWYHGTLDRNEAKHMLQEFANNRFQKEIANETHETNGESIDHTSGTFLVRYSDRMRGNFVLTLLYEEHAKHFKIQTSVSVLINLKYKFKSILFYILYLTLQSNYLYIDEGPYMTSLEHLIQHYQISSDGLPINLKYPVPPKPKPPIPLFSTIPKKNSHKFSPSAPENIQYALGEKSDTNNHNPFSRAKSSDEFALVSPTKSSSDSPPQKQPYRNLSVPNENSTNDSVVTTPPRESKGKSDILNFRSLKLKSKGAIILDGMKSLKKNKSKHSKDIAKNRNSIENLEYAKQLMQNISFSSQLPPTPVQNTNDELYNIPKNNCAIVDINIEEEIKEKNNSIIHEEDETYFIESDRNINHNEMADKEQEELYFTEAPKINSSRIVQQQPLQQSSQSQEKSPSNEPQHPGFQFNAAGYVISKDIPMFPDLPTPSPTSIVPPRLKPLRLGSTISTTTIGSQRSESEFLPMMQQTSEKSPNYFIPAENLILENVLGQGEFGSVYKGFLIESIPVDNEQTPTIVHIPVAIKTLHDEHCKENRIEFLREASVMLHLRHHCIVQMIGISKGPPLRMIQELVPLGSMLTYLQNNSDKIQPQFELKIWASQIACGMNYLESQHFVHRDLAARNILLASRNQAKISDFGLSRALGAGNDYYQASQGGKWPIKWYAPESFNFGTFSHASDVWSFGVTLWEMFSLGAPPYGDMKGVDVIKSIEAGQRLPKPTMCPDNVSEIMESCWNYYPRNRPTFKQLTQLFLDDPDYQNITELIQTGDIS